MNFIFENFETIVGMIVGLVLIGWGVYTRQWNLVKLSAYQFMLSAERLLQAKPGKEKMEEVFVATWASLPKWLKKFVTQETLREKLQEWYELAKDYLDNSKIDNSNK